MKIFAIYPAHKQKKKYQESKSLSSFSYLKITAIDPRNKPIEKFIEANKLYSVRRIAEVGREVFSRFQPFLGVLRINSGQNSFQKY